MGAAGGYGLLKTGIDAYVEKMADDKRQIDALRSAAPVKSAVITNPNGSRMTFDDGQIKLWPNFDTDPDVFALIYTDSSDNRMTRWFAPTDDGGDYLANSFSMQGATATETGNAWIFTDGVLTLSADERAYIKGAAGIDLVTGGDLKIFELPTTGSAANIRLEPGTAQIQYVTSSRRYKRDIEDLDVDVEAFLKLRPRSWRDNGEVERDPETTRRNVGFIAEEVAELGLPFVDRNDEGQPDALQYDRFMTGAVQVMQAQAAQIADLTAELAAYKAATDARLEALENN